MFGVSGILFFRFVWLAVPFGVYAMLLGMQSLWQKRQGFTSFVSIFLGAISLVLSLGFFLRIMLPGILRQGAILI